MLVLKLNCTVERFYNAGEATKRILKAYLSLKTCELGFLENLREYHIFELFRISDDEAQPVGSPSDDIVVFTAFEHIQKL